MPRGQWSWVRVMGSVEGFFTTARWNSNPVGKLLGKFLENEARQETAGNYDKMRLLGYVLSISFDEVVVITCDAFRKAVGGLPLNAFLIMVPSDLPASHPPYFILLRVVDTSTTPLEKEVQQTFFELHKRSMPELDIFTQSELQWSGLCAAIVGVIYPNPDDRSEIEFAADAHDLLSAHRYVVYKPGRELLKLAINQFVAEDDAFVIGDLRMTENRLAQLLGTPDESVIEVQAAKSDFVGTRTGIFGKTRLGKTNVGKRIIENNIQKNPDVGHLIFDMDGEFANDNPQDDDRSIASMYPDDCAVYALRPKVGTPSEPLKLNFYEIPDQAMPVLASLVRADHPRPSNYIAGFIATDLPSLEDMKTNDHSLRTRAKRQILIYWAVLKRAGFDVDEGALKRSVSAKLGRGFNFNPRIHGALRQELYENNNPPASNNYSLDDVATEFQLVARFLRANPDSELLNSTGSHRPLFQETERALLDMLEPRTQSSTGPAVLRPYRMYHDPDAGNFVTEILELLDHAKTVILDLGNANPVLLQYYSDYLSQKVFQHQVEKFSTNKLEGKYTTLYFEEAHNLFPAKETSGQPSIYQRLAKEGAKYHIGLIYVTQSPTSINRDLIAQTENIFTLHLSSSHMMDFLCKVNVAFERVKRQILRCRTVGYAWMLTRSHRFVIPIQIRKFGRNTSETGED